jgi:hypothetical protein
MENTLNGQKVFNPEMDDNGCGTGKERQTIGFTVEMGNDDTVTCC